MKKLLIFILSICNIFGYSINLELTDAIRKSDITIVSSILKNEQIPYKYKEVYIALAEKIVELRSQGHLIGTEKRTSAVFPSIYIPGAIGLTMYTAISGMFSLLNPRLKKQTIISGLLATVLVLKIVNDLNYSQRIIDDSYSNAQDILLVLKAAKNN